MRAALVQLSVPAIATAGGVTARAIAPSGASRGSREALDLRDGGSRLGGKDVRNKLGMTLRVPCGVVAAITPFNFPLNLVAHKVAPALAVGCPFVLKPASRTPIGALIIGEILAQTDLPKGAFSVLPCTRHGAELFTTDERFKLLSFTGSPEVGWDLKARAGKKKVTLELGGNAPFIVFDDADVDEAVKGAIICKFRNAGQTCVCANRILVQDGIYDEFTEKLAAAMAGLKLGDGAQDGVDIGPLINEKAANDVLEFVDNAVAHGAQVAAGGKRSSLGSCFVEPTLLTHVTDDMRVFREEIFGPVAPLFRFADEAEAVHIANDTDFGLGGSVWTRDAERGERIARQLQCGCAFVNGMVKSDPRLPFGGVKNSGYGRELSRLGIHEFVNAKTIWIR